MRIDKFLKVSRIIKRRTVANDACDGEHVSVNDRQVKASYTVKEGDIIEIAFGERTLRVRVKNVKDFVTKADASTLYEVID
jgi:ribosomal 50S subunit-recycling heat shock protein